MRSELISKRIEAEMVEKINMFISLGLQGGRLHSL